MARSLGAAALVMSAACLLMGALVLLVPEPSVGLGIAFLATGAVLAAAGLWGVTRPADAAPPPSPAGAAGRPRADRPKSVIGQLLDGLYFFR